MTGFKIYRDIEKESIWVGTEPYNFALVFVDNKLHILFATATNLIGESEKSLPVAIPALLPPDPPIDPPALDPPPVVLPPRKEILQFQESEDSIHWETTVTVVREVKAPKRFFRMAITPTP